VSCIVTPGFDFADFELADRDALLAEHPQDADLIRELT
jgi:predicted cupin superfamily sugar epimerase